MISYKDLQLKIFSPPCFREFSADFEAVYRLWKALWTESYIEMGKEPLITSDTFTRQHDILALFYKANPIASVCHRYTDLNSDSMYDDSYFKNSWSHLEVNHLKTLTGTAVLGSQISLDKNFRKSTTGIDIKRLISFLSLKYAQSLNVDVILGMMRLDRGMEKVFYEAGAKVLARARQYYSTTVDLVAFYPKKNPITIPDLFQFQVEFLLKNAQNTNVVQYQNQLKQGG